MSKYMITSESELSEAVLLILSRVKSGAAPYSYLIHEIRGIVKLTTADKAPSIKRPLEEMWEQRVRNIRSHQRSDGNYIKDGLLKGVKGGLEITAAGLAHVKKKKS